MRVLLIEDDRRLAERTAEYLGEHGVDVEIAGRGELGLERAQSEAWDLVLLDIMLPDLDGLELCRRLRQRTDVPVVMLSARGEEVDRVVGLELGADDYLAKPFSPRELLARIRAVLRRHSRPSPGAPSGAETPAFDAQDAPASGGNEGLAAGGERLLTRGPLRIDRGRRVVELAGVAVELTAYQFDLLWALAEAPEQVLDRGHLYKRVRELRGEAPADFDPSVDRSVDVHLSKVRQALEEARPGASAALRTVRGVGYVLDPELLEGSGP